MNKKNRPLSPHLQIYKPQISSFTSILHRLTGIFLYIGVVAICWVIVYYTYQVEIIAEGQLATEETCDGCYLKYILYTLVLAWTFSLYFHLCNGIRHLFWDIGKGFEKNLSNRNGIIVIVTSIVMTAASAYYVFFNL